LLLCCNYSYEKHVGLEQVSCLESPHRFSSAKIIATRTKHIHGTGSDVAYSEVDGDLRFENGTYLHFRHMPLHAEER